MTLREYAKRVNELVKAGLGDAIVISSSDDEGNSYGDVFYPPGEVDFEDFGSGYMGEIDKSKRYVCIN